MGYEEALVFVLNLVLEIHMEHDVVFVADSMGNTVVIAGKRVDALG